MRFVVSLHRIHQNPGLYTVLAENCHKLEQGDRLRVVFLAESLQLTLLEEEVPRDTLVLPYTK